MTGLGLRVLRTGLFIANEEKRLLGNCVFKAFDGKVENNVGKRSSCWSSIVLSLNFNFPHTNTGEEN